MGSKSRNQMTVELVPTVESRIKVIVDGALLLTGSTGAKLLVEHDRKLPVSLHISTPEISSSARSRAPASSW